MSQIILIEDNEEKKRMYSLNLNVYLGTDVVAKNNSQEAMKLLDVHPSINLIVCNPTIDQERSAINICEYLRKEGRKIPIISLGPVPNSSQLVTVLDQRPEMHTLLTEVAKVLNITARDISLIPIPSIFPIPIQCFFSLSNTPCDVYLRIKHSDREDQYLKRFSKDEEIHGGIIQRYMEYGETHLYVAAGERILFVEGFNKEIISKLKSEGLSTEEKNQATESAMEMIAVNLEKIGLNEQTVELCQASMTSIEKNIQKFPSMQALFKHLLGNRHGAIYLHCQLITYTCLHILKHIGWGIQEHEKKLGFVAFFHDLLLFKEKLVNIRSQEELDKSDCDEKEKRSVIKHAQWISEIVKKFPNAPMDVDVIIRQHHGVPTGNGFTKSYQGNISPLAMVFIVAEEFTHILMENRDKKINLQQVIREMEKKFPLLSYRKIIETLKTISL